MTDPAGDAHGPEAPAAAHPLAPKGAFQIIDEDKSGFDPYNITPVHQDQIIPEDQARLQNEIYATRGILKLLREQGVLGAYDKDNVDEPAIAKEFSKRIKEVAGVGLVGWAQVGLATLAITALRNELLVRKGRSAVYRYLTNLAAAGAVGAVIGFVIELLAGCAIGPRMSGFGNVLIGAMAGAWLSAAANRRDVTLEMLPELLASKNEPAIRMGFVALLAWAAAAFLQKKVITISIGNVAFSGFAGDPMLAFVLGVIAGIGERARSVQLLNRANTFVAK